MKQKVLFNHIAYVIIFLLVVSTIGCIDDNVDDQKIKQLERQVEELQKEHHELKESRNESEGTESNFNDSVHVYVDKNESTSNIVMPKSGDSEITPIFISVFSFGREIDAGALQVAFSKESNNINNYYEIARSDEPLEVVHLGSRSERSGKRYLQFYPNGDVIWYFPTNSVHNIHAFVDPKEDLGVILIDSKEFSLDEIKKFKNWDNWQWYSIEPGIWTSIRARNDLGFGISVELEEIPEYFWITSVRSASLNGVAITKYNIAKEMRLKENYIFDEGVKGRIYYSGIYVMASTEIKNINCPEIDTFEVHYIETEFINDFWKKYQ